jgi:hypothetical protein
MRIVPYETAPVKVRVAADVQKLGYFPGLGFKGRVCPGRVDGRTAESPRAKWLVDDAIATGNGFQIGKFCAKSLTGITDTDL